MLSYLLKEWSKTPEPWFSKRHLKELSDEQFSELVARKILLYDLPRGEESTDEHRCTHGCSLFLEKRQQGYDAFCLEHPEERTLKISEDALCRYRLCLEAIIKNLRKANDLEDEPFVCGRGFFVGHKNHGDKVIAVVLYPSVTKDDLLAIAGLTVNLKDCDAIFVVAPELYVKWTWTRPQLGDRIVLFDMFEVFNEDTFELSFDWGLFKLRQRGVLNDRHIEIPGNLTRDGHEVRINGQPWHLTDAPFILLLRFVQGYFLVKDRWVTSKELVDDGINPEGLYQAVGRLKKDLRWDDVLENDKKRYRLSMSVTEVSINCKKLLAQDNTRVKEIAKKISKKISRKTGTLDSTTV